MSRTKPTEFETKQLTVPCQHCLAPASWWCTTTGHRWSTFLHAERYYEVLEA